MIVVLDTNVWISALEFGGTPDLAVARALTLETAWKAQADYLVAGDKDLLSLGTFGRTLIVSPAGYLEFQ